MISRAIAFASAMSEPTSSPSQSVRPLRPTTVRRGSTTKSRAPLRTPLRTWWKKIGCVSRAFEPQRRIDVRLLDLPVGRRAAARSEHRRQTDDAGGVSGAVAAVDVVGADHLARELLRQEVHLVGRLRAGEDPEGRRRVRARIARRRPSAARSSASSQVAGRSSPSVAHERRRQAALRGCSHWFPSESLCGTGVAAKPHDTGVLGPAWVLSVARRPPGRSAAGRSVVGRSARGSAARRPRGASPGVAPADGVHGRLCPPRAGVRQREDPA